MQPFQITKHNLQRMNARPYPQKKDVDSIALNCISASTWGSHQKIGNKNQLNDFCNECNDNAVAKTSVCKSLCV